MESRIDHDDDRLLRERIDTAIDVKAVI